MVAGAIIATAFGVAVIHVRVQPFSGRIAVLLVSHGAKRHSPFRTRLFAPQDRVVLLAADVGSLKPDELVFFRSVNDHACAILLCLNI